MRAPTASAATRLVALLACGELLAGEPARCAPLEAYGRLPSLEEVALSPDGSRIAYVTTDGNTRVIGIKKFSDFNAGYGVRVSEQKLRAIAWADDTHLMITTSVTTLPWGFVGLDHEWFMLQVLDVETHKLQQIPNLNHSGRASSEEFMNVIADEPMVRNVGGHTVLFVQGFYVTDRTLPALFRFDLATSGQRMVRQGSESTEGWLVGADGEIAAEEDYFEREQRWSLKLHRDGSMSEVTSVHAPIDVPSVLGFGPQTDTLLIGEVEDGIRVWKLLSLRDGTLGPSLAEHASLEFPIEDATSHRMIGGARVEDYAQYVFFDPKVQQRWDAILHAFPGEHVQFESASSDFNKFVIRVDGAAHGFAYAVVDLGTGQAKLIGSVYEGIKPLETRRITYTAGDGFTIPAYLTLPAGTTPKNLPLIVLPHGGPAVRDTADFDWWTQALADQGYAVLRPNYRGSDLGTRHLEAGFGQWGRKMQTDLSDGVRYLAKEGVIDPARVCIVGASYGGYAALAGVTLDPGVYRCAVSIAGLSDLKRMLRWESGQHPYGERTSERYWNRFMGASGPSDPALDAISPIKHVDAITVPVMLIHGRDDTVVPFEQSSEMYDAMKRARKVVELVPLRHEDHWLSRSETRLQMLQASVEFLRTNNPPHPSN